jgi:hypothetical protein
MYIPFNPHKDCQKQKTHLNKPGLVEKDLNISQPQQARVYRKIAVSENGRSTKNI